MVREPDMLPELEPLPEPEVDPEELPAPDPEPESEPEELDVEPWRPRELDDVEPESAALPAVLLEPESILPVDAPPRSPLLLCELQPANANTPANSGITKSLLFIVTSSIVADERNLATRGDTLSE